MHFSTMIYYTLIEEKKMRSIIVLLFFFIIFIPSMAQQRIEKNIQQNQLISNVMPIDVPSTASSGTDRGVHIRISVFDADGKVPIELARIVLTRNGKFVGEAATNPAGQARFIDIEPGTYVLQVWFVGYRTFSDSLLIDNNHASKEVLLYATGNTTAEVDVTGQRELAVTSINLLTGNQTFESETYHPAPIAQMTNLIQENVMGAARAPTGEVHIRGHHGEFTYYVDGIPVPLGVFGGLNEVVDPKAIDRATFITGGFAAEYGGQNSAIIELNNRVPTGSFHLDASIFGGSCFVFNGTKPFSPGSSGSSIGDTLGSRVGPFRALNSNGQSLSLSDHIGNLGFYISGSRQETDRRIDQPVDNLFHDHGQDYFLYGKFDYILSDIDYLTANLNFGRTNTEVPYDSTEQIASDVQTTTNSFQTISYFRAIDSEPNEESNLFIGVYAREGGLIHTPGSVDPPYFQFVGDTANTYTIAEDRSFTTIGFRSTYDKRLSHQFSYKVGLNLSSTSGIEDFTSRNSAGNSGPSINTNIHGSDFGVFAQTEWHPMEWTSFEAGLRYDQHITPDVPLQNQVSPRLRWNILIDEDNNAYLYYGRMFVPTNIEGLRSIAINVSTAQAPTLPERDDFYEAVYTHLFTFGLRSKLAVYYEFSAPGVDDQTVGSSAIKTPVNIEQVRTTGIEIGLSYSDPVIPFSGYINTSLIHAYGTGTVSGGFLDYSDDGPATDLDHDQRLSIVAGFNYQPQNWFANIVAIYGSGLTNGNPYGETYQTGLFDFNTAQHTMPSWILNVGGGYTFHLQGGASLQPSIYITNLLDHDHLIKGAYFSAASYEERRNVVLKVAVHI
jgi:hypothetical protein